MKWLLAALAFLFCTLAHAELITTSTGGGSSSITAGTTPVTCSSGTTGVLFQASGKVGCNSNFTTDGSGATTIGGSLGIASVYVIQSNGFYFRDGGSNAINFGSGNLMLWKNNADGALGTADIGLARNAAGVLEVDTGAAYCSAAAANCRDLVARHMAGAGPVPTASACAGFSLDTGSTDIGGRVSFTSATSCAITFGTSFANPPFCWVAPGSALSTTDVTRTNAVLTANFGTAQTSMTYGCSGI